MELLSQLNSWNEDMVTIERAAELQADAKQNKQNEKAILNLAGNGIKHLYLLQKAEDSLQLISGSNWDRDPVEEYAGLLTELELILKEDEIGNDEVKDMEGSLKRLKDIVSTRWEYRISDFKKQAKIYVHNINLVYPEKAREYSMYKTGGLIMRWPVSPDTLDKIIQENKNINEMFQTLNLNPKVNVFLDKINNGKATLFDLTPEVIDWIKQQNLEKKLKLSF